MNKFELPNLPYAQNALEPIMSAETLSFHHGKHHKAYVDKLNTLLPGSEFENSSLEEIVLKSSGVMFNQAGQVWNHTFFWNSMRPAQGEAGKPGKTLAAAIEKAFGGYDQFVEKFNTTGVNTFGSGWAWLVANADGSLEVVSTKDAENPMRQGKTPILTADVWEHAYYIDYRNARAEFLKKFWTLANWDFAEKNYLAHLQAKGIKS